jgi:hypothetical protein
VVTAGSATYTDTVSEAYEIRRSSLQGSSASSGGACGFDDDIVPGRCCESLRSSVRRASSFCGIFASVSCVAVDLATGEIEQEVTSCVLST